MATPATPVSPFVALQQFADPEDLTPAMRADIAAREAAASEEAEAKATLQALDQVTAEIARHDAAERAHLNMIDRAARDARLRADLLKTADKLAETKRVADKLPRVTADTIREAGTVVDKVLRSRRAQRNEALETTTKIIANNLDKLDAFREKPVGLVESHMRQDRIRHELLKAAVSASPASPVSDQHVRDAAHAMLDALAEKRVQFPPGESKSQKSQAVSEVDQQNAVIRTGRLQAIAGLAHDAPEAGWNDPAIQKSVERYLTARDELDRAMRHHCVLLKTQSEFGINLMTVQDRQNMAVAERKERSAISRFTNALDDMRQYAPDHLKESEIAIKYWADEAVQKADSVKALPPRLEAWLVENTTETNRADARTVIQSRMREQAKWQLDQFKGGQADKRYWYKGEKFDEVFRQDDERLVSEVVRKLDLYKDQAQSTQYAEEVAAELRHQQDKNWVVIEPNITPEEQKQKLHDWMTEGSAAPVEAQTQEASPAHVRELDEEQNLGLGL